MTPSGRDTLAEQPRHDAECRFEPVDVGLRTLEVFDVTFNGYGGQPIKGWLILPPQRAHSRCPCVVAVHRLRRRARLAARLAAVERAPATPTW